MKLSQLSVLKNIKVACFAFPSYFFLPCKIHDEEAFNFQKCIMIKCTHGGYTIHLQMVTMLILNENKCDCRDCTFSVPLSEHILFLVIWYFKGNSINEPEEIN